MAAHAGFVGRGKSSDLKGGDRVDAPPSASAVAAREICYQEAGDVAELLATEEGCAQLRAYTTARLLDAPSENESRSLLGALRSVRDALSDLHKVRDLRAKEALAEQIALERAERARMESGVTRASADVALPAVPGGEPH